MGAKPKGDKSKKSEKEGSEDMEKGQMWSVDVIIGIVIFVSIVTVFYTTLSGTGEDVRKKLQGNADTILIKFTQSPNLRVISGDNTLNTTRLEELANMDYEALKDALGVEGDFCIYVEDENGRIFPIGGRTSFGKGDINISDMPCGSPV